MKANRLTMIWLALLIAVAGACSPQSPTAVPTMTPNLEPTATSAPPAAPTATQTTAPTAVPTATPTTTPEPTMPAPVESSVAATTLTGTVWQWVRFTGPEQQFDVEKPEGYTVEFLEDGTVNIEADCNKAKGAETVSQEGAL